MKLFRYFIFFLCSASFAADSSNIIPAQTTKNEYPLLNVPAPTIYNESYYKYPCCPGMTNGGNYSCPGVLSCPDINGNVVGAQNCPDACVVTRSVGAVSQPTTSGGQVTLVTGDQDAVCPPGYASVSVFNMGVYKDIAGRNTSYYPQNLPNEIIWQDQMLPVINITPKSQFDTYRNNGYSCTANSNGQPNAGWKGTAWICQNGGSGIPPHGLTDGYTWESDVAADGTPRLVYLGSYPSGNPVTFYSLYDNGTCYDRCGSSTEVASSCSFSTTTRKYMYNLWMAQCTPPAGLVATTLNQPVSVLCARVKLNWN